MDARTAGTQPLSVMLEASTLLNPRAFDRLVGAWPISEAERYRFHVSERLRRLLIAEHDHGGDLEYLAGARGDRQRVAGQDLLEWLEMARVTPYEARDAAEGYVRPIREVVSRTAVSAVYAEQMAFLETRSWVLSGVRQFFSALIRAGAVALEIGRRGLDAAVQRTLKTSPDDVIEHAERLRALVKWLAVGGSSVAGLFAPVAGMIVGSATGFFLLMDP